MKEETEKNEPFGTVTDSYVCIYPEEAQQVFSYLEGLNPSLKDIVQRHLHFCIHCREKVTNQIGRAHV